MFVIYYLVQVYWLILLISLSQIMKKMKIVYCIFESFILHNFINLLDENNIEVHFIVTITTYDDITTREM